MPNLANNKILVVVAHPDVETIGCGGSISRFVSAGSQVRVMLPMRGQLEKTTAQWQARLDKFKTAAHILGAECITGNEPIDEAHATQRLPIWWTCSPNKAPGRAGCSRIGSKTRINCIRSYPVRLKSRRALSRSKKHTVLFETPSSTDQGFFQDFCPNFYIGISNVDLSKKMQAMAVYADQHAPGRTPADLDHHARYRGSQIGQGAAEAFYLARSFF